MSEWIRHRGSKEMPKCLEGKRFEVRYRDGTSFEFNNSALRQASDMWTHDGVNGDIMAYRVVSEPAATPAITPPDYSKGFPVGTTAKDIGAKVGDEFVVAVDNGYGYFKLGERIKLIEDDGSACPLFSNGTESNFKDFANLSFYQPKTAIELQAEEVGIPEPVRLVDDEQDAAETTNKYQRTIKGVTIDVYDVLSAFGVICQARGHAIKKLLMAGQRGHKDEAQDLREAVQAIERSIELVGK